MVKRLVFSKEKMLERLAKEGRTNTISEKQMEIYTKLDGQPIEKNIMTMLIYNRLEYVAFVPGGGAYTVEIEDCVENKGQRETEREFIKPPCKLLGENGNIFNLMAIACRTLQQHGYNNKAMELEKRIIGGDAESYAEAILIIMEYVDVLG